MPNYANPGNGGGRARGGARGRGQGGIRGSANQSDLIGDINRQIQSTSLRHSLSTSSGISSSSRPNTAMSDPQAWDTITFTTRPGKVEAIRPAFQVKTNYFKVELKQEVRLWTYSVMVKKNKMLLRRREDIVPIFWNAIDGDHRVPSNHNLLIFNGRDRLYSLEELNIPNEVANFKAEIDRKYYTVTVQRTKNVIIHKNPKTIQEISEFREFIDLVLSARITYPLRKESNAFYKFGPTIFYRPTEGYPIDQRFTVALGRGLEGWAGFFAACKMDIEMGLCVNIDIKHSVFFARKKNLIHFYCEVLTRKPFSEINRELYDKAFVDYGMNRFQISQLSAMLKGLTLTYTVPIQGGKVKNFKFSEVLPKASSAYSFFDDEGKKINLAEYFEKKYNYKFQCRHFPIIVINKKKNIVVPMELVTTSMDPFRFPGKVTEFEKAKMIRATAYSPLERLKIIQGLVSNDGGHEDKPMYIARQDDYMKSAGVTFDKSIQLVPATRLPAPALQFGDGVKFEDTDNTGQWELAQGQGLKKIISKPISMVYNTIFLIPNSKNVQYRRHEGPAKTIAAALQLMGVQMPNGINPVFGNYNEFDCQSTSWKSLEEKLKMFKTLCEKDYPEAIPILFLVFPYKCTSYKSNQAGYFSEYRMTKFICDMKIGIRCQGILTQTYFENLTTNPNSCSTAHNIALKVLAKLGAVHHTVVASTPNDSWNLVTNPASPTLILGIDVCHPSLEERVRVDKNEKRGREELKTLAGLSVATIVGNVNVDLTKYEASSKVQYMDQEFTFNLKEEFSTRIKRFISATGSNPAQIVIIRDGVGESMFQKSLYHEVESLKQSMDSLGLVNPMPKLTYIVMTKRHHMRAFPIDTKSTGEGGNFKPGTLIESGVTSKTTFDFFLYSHPGPLGTSRPSHYYVLHDEWNPSPTFWQETIFNLSYQYARCLKSISQPAPVQYAHLAAKRAKDYLAAFIKENEERLIHINNEFLLYSELNNHINQLNLDGMLFV